MATDEWQIVILAHLDRYSFQVNMLAKGSGGFAEGLIDLQGVGQAVGIAEVEVPCQLQS